MESLVAANLRSRPTRTVISILAVGLGVILMLIVGGITSGTLSDYLKRTVSVGADFRLEPSGASVFYGLNSGTLPIGYEKKLKEVQGVGVIASVLAKFSSTDYGLVFGIDLQTFNQLPGRLHTLEGRESLSGDEAIVDELYAKQHNLRPGMPVTVLSHTFTVSAICATGSVVRVFVPLKTLQELNETPDKVSAIFIKAMPGQSTEIVYARIKNTFPGLSIANTSDPALLLANTKLPGFKELNFTVVLVSMLLGFLVILLAMYTTIFERTREIGILKSLGASRAFIVGLIFKESAMISVLGVLFGLVGSEIVRVVILSSFPTLQVSMNIKDLLQAAGLGIVAGTLGAMYPAYKASRLDPVKALSYE